MLTYITAISRSFRSKCWTLCDVVRRYSMLNHLKLRCC